MRWGVFWKLGLRASSDSENLAPPPPSVRDSNRKQNARSCELALNVKCQDDLSQYLGYLWNCFPSSAFVSKTLPYTLIIMFIKLYCSRPYLLDRGRDCTSLVQHPIVKIIPSLCALEIQLSRGICLGLPIFKSRVSPLYQRASLH